MRFALALLLVINAFLLGVQSGVLNMPTPPRPDRVPQPLREEQLTRIEAVAQPIAGRLHPRSQLSALHSASLPEHAAPSSEQAPRPTKEESPPPAMEPLPQKAAPRPEVAPQSASASPTPGPAAAAALPSKQACRLLKLTSQKELTLVQDLARAFPALELHLVKAPKESHREEPAHWWVLTAKQPNEQAAERLAKRLREQGVRDLLILRDAGPNQWRISLGLFSSRHRAEQHRKALQAQGISGLEVVPRSQTAHPAAAPQLRLEGSSAELQRFAARIRARLPHLRLDACPK